MSETPETHKQAAQDLEPVRVAVVTVSDSRRPSDDVNGPYLRRRIEDAGHRTVDYRLIPDEPDQLEVTLEELSRGPAQVLIFNGGTGLSKRDNSVDVIEPLLEKTLPGFGEIFRVLSYEQVGSAAILSRATAGSYRGRCVFLLPGSPKAVELAWSRLIEPELRHLVWEMGKGDAEPR